MNKPSGTGFWSVVKSVLAAGIGVQSQANKERDFQEGDPRHFIIGGIIGTLVLVGGIVLFVRYLVASGS